MSRKSLHHTKTIHLARPDISIHYPGNTNVSELTNVNRQASILHLAFS